MINIEEIKLYNPGVLLTKLDDDIFSQVKENMYSQINPEEVLKSLKQDTFSFSGSNPDLNFKIDSGFTRVLTDMFSEYSKRFNFHTGNKFAVNRNAWVNYQRKTEFNQLHYHSDIAVYILYVSIPYKLEEELKNPSEKIICPIKSSLFEFVYSKIDGGVHQQNLKIDKSWEGTLIMFPSYMLHQVYPFYTSNDYRISIAGNVRLLK